MWCIVGHTVGVAKHVLHSAVTCQTLWFICIVSVCLMKCADVAITAPDRVWCGSVSVIGMHC